MLALLQEDQVLYDIPTEDLCTHPDAGTLGADLIAGGTMYQSLQILYRARSP